MESVINCDKCLKQFNNLENLPKLFPCCGITYCISCIKKDLTQHELGPVKCDQCKTQFDSVDKLVVNTKLLRINNLNVSIQSPI